MFTKRLENLLNLLDIKSSSEFARYAECDRSYISRLRSGERTPKPDSRAAATLSGNIYTCAVEKNLLKNLCEAVGCPAEEKPAGISKAIGEYLFEGEENLPQQKSIKKGRVQNETFGNKLNAVMELSKLSNVRLARLANIDTSLVSRYRRGLRSPKANRDITDSICRVLLNRIKAQNRLDSLCELMGVTQQSFVDEDSLKSWLCDFDNVDSSVIEDFLEGFENFSPDIKIPLLTPEQAVGNEAVSDTYIGEKGLQKSVLRFFGDVLRSGVKELWLYSDQNMNWMTSNPDFSLRWMSLMIACVKSGIRITIIHNIDRGLEEMIEAVKKWLPLYMSGRIESFYSTKKNGNRFSHTIFLAPDAACVSAVYVAGREENARYHYYDDAESLRYFNELYGTLMADCRPLVQVETHVPSDPPTGKEVIELSSIPDIPFDNIKIAITHNSVIIRHLSPPIHDFIVTHPLMRNAFISYAKNFQNQLN